MTKLRKLFTDCSQSPWLDNLTREHLTSGKLEELRAAGLRGVTSNPTIFQKAIESSSLYDDQFHDLVSSDVALEEIYWELVIDDIKGALRLFRPLYDESRGGDGFVSIELDPHLAHDTDGSVAAARQFHERIAEPNLLVKIPGTAEGVPAIRQMIGEGKSINVTLLFSLDRYSEVIEAYLTGLETYADAGGDLSTVHSVASFFVSRVDTEVDQRLDAIGSDEALGLRGTAAVAQTKLAYQLFRDRFQGSRWEALAARGARYQRPLWASTSTKNPRYSDTLYVDSLIGADTVNTMPDATIDTFEKAGTLARTVDRDVDHAQHTLEDLASAGVDLADVSRVLEDQGVASFAKSYDELLQSLEAKAANIRGDHSQRER
jgi:transaldolase